MRIPAGDWNEEPPTMQHDDGRSHHRRDNAIVCKKCQAANAGNSMSKFCDQCGHRLRTKPKVTEQSKNQCHGKQRSRSPSPASALGPSTTDGGWFWGSDELPPLATRGSTTANDLTEARKSPPMYPLAKARTANGGHSTSFQVERRMRRVSSFGHPPCLPALPLLPTRGNAVCEQLSPTTSPKKAVANLAIESAFSDTCGVLWGEVLADVIGEFETQRIILAVEIDSDEGCLSILAQKMQIEEAARSKYVVARGTSQLRYKYNELEKKVRINKEKLTLVQHRLATLSAQRDREQHGEGREEPDREEMPQHLGAVMQPSSRDKQRECDKRRGSEEPGPKKTKVKKKRNATKNEKSVRVGSNARQRDELEVAATLIQKRFRVSRARRLFAEMVKRAYQRVFDPDTKRYFYYDARTRQSQWELPQALARATATTIRRPPRCVPSARSLNWAASRIQALYRRRAARHAVRQLLLQVYEKVYDAKSGTFYYYCAKTQTSTWAKPKLLQDGDIPTLVSEHVAHDGSRLACAIEDAAATKIQTLFRNRATRQFIRDLAKGNIETHYDADAQAWYCFNTRTQQSFWEQTRHASLRAAVRPR